MFNPSGLFQSWVGFIVVPLCATGSVRTKILFSIPLTYLQVLTYRFNTEFNRVNISVSLLLFFYASHDVQLFHPLHSLKSGTHLKICLSFFLTLFACRG